MSTPMLQRLMAVPHIVVEHPILRLGPEPTPTVLRRDRRLRRGATSIMGVERAQLELVIQQPPDPVVRVPLRQQGPRLSPLEDLLVL